MAVAGVALLLAGPTQAARAAAIDVLLVYEQNAANWVEQNGGREAFSQDIIGRMNQAMHNSNLDLTFRLVHEMAIDYVTTANGGGSLSTDLEALQAGQGYFNEVHAARDTHGADLVAMLVDHGSDYGTVGIAYELSSWTGLPDYAFSVNAIRAVDITHTLTHEVGHNLGAGHAKNQASSPGPAPLADYAAGWYFTGSNDVAYHTIMAYNHDGFGGQYQEAPLFSNPVVTHEGGLAGDERDGDNARLLSQTKHIVADYRQAVAEAYTVTAHAGQGGGVTPGEHQVDHHETASFTVTPLADYVRSEVEGSCPSGSFSGNEYTTGAISADCDLFFTFTLFQDEQPNHSRLYLSAGTSLLVVENPIDLNLMPGSAHGPLLLRLKEGGRLGNLAASLAAEIIIELPYDDYQYALDPNQGTIKVRNGDSRQVAVLPVDHQGYSPLLVQNSLTYRLRADFNTSSIKEETAISPQLPDTDASDASVLYLEGGVSLLTVTDAMALRVLPGRQYQETEIVLQGEAARLTELSATIARNARFTLDQSGTYSYSVNHQRGTVDIFNHNQQVVLSLPLNAQGETPEIRIGEGSYSRLSAN